jgi:hypothetical protein
VSILSCNARPTPGRVPDEGGFAAAGAVAVAVRQTCSPASRPAVWWTPDSFAGAGRSDCAWRASWVPDTTAARADRASGVGAVLFVEGDVAAATAAAAVGTGVTAPERGSESTCFHCRSSVSWGSSPGRQIPRRRPRHGGLGARVKRRRAATRHAITQCAEGLCASSCWWHCRLCRIGR